MFLYDDLLDQELLEKEKLMIIVVTGMYTAVDSFKDYTAMVSGLGFNVTGIYNPSHGKGFSNFMSDASRAIGGVYGNVSRKTTEQFNGILDKLVKSSPKDTRFAFVTFSEANVVYFHSMNRYPGSLENFAQIGLGSPFFGKTRIDEYLYISPSTDPTRHIAQYQPVEKRINPRRVLLPDSPPNCSNEHAFDCPTTNPLLRQALINYRDTGKLLR